LERLFAACNVPENASDEQLAANATEFHAAVLQASKDPVVVKKLNDIGFEVVGGTPAEFSKFLDAELARWKGVVDAGGIKQSD